MLDDPFSIDKYQYRGIEEGQDSEYLMVETAEQRIACIGIEFCRHEIVENGE